jgi:outer membrane protein assembly factor BamB
MYRKADAPERDLVIIALNGEVAAIDRQSGEEKWRAAILGASVGTMALAIASGRVYTATEEEIVACFDYRTGDRVWQATTRAFGRPTLLVDGDQVIVARGAHLECVSRETGELLWHAVLRGMGKGVTAIGLPPRDAS